LYLRDPASLATVELRPSAPTTSLASTACSDPSRATRTPVTRPRSLTSAVTFAPIQTSAPAATAASARMGSSSSRRTDIAPPTSPGCCGPGTRARNPSSRMSTWLTIGAPVARKALSTPSRLRKASAAASKMCVESVSRGNVACSTSATDSPARANSVASGDPAHRPPTTTTSNSLPIGPPDHLASRQICRQHRRYRAEERGSIFKPHGMYGMALARDPRLPRLRGMTPFFNVGTLSEGSCGQGTSAAHRKFLTGSRLPSVVVSRLPGRREQASLAYL
jgi:hypothetical protein